MTETSNPTDGASRLGQVVSGRYRIQELLGEGGMGAVYLAEHTLMRKRVALKLLHPDMSGNDEVLARFRREAEAAAHIEHPNVAAATDFGQTEDGAFFLVLALVPFIWQKLGEGYAIYVLILLLIPMASSTQSIIRYLLPIFPIYILLGWWGRRSAVDHAILTSFAVLLGVLTSIFVNWYFVA